MLRGAMDNAHYNRKTFVWGLVATGVILRNKPPRETKGKPPRETKGKPLEKPARPLRQPQ